MLPGLGLETDAAKPLAAQAQLPVVSLPKRFNGRRIVEHDGQYYEFPSEKPKPKGNGPGELALSLGWKGYVNPEIIWQPDEAKKSRAIKPVPRYQWNGKVKLDEASQRKSAGPDPIKHRGYYFTRPTIAGSPDRGEVVKWIGGKKNVTLVWQSAVPKKTRSPKKPPSTLPTIPKELIARFNGDRQEAWRHMRAPRKLVAVPTERSVPWALLTDEEQKRRARAAKNSAGVLEHGGRFYPRPRSSKTKKAQRGKVIGVQGGDKMWWRSTTKLSDGSPSDPLMVKRLSATQIEAIRFACWLGRTHKTALERAQYLQSMGAMFVINTSGGKDSQAMYLYLTRVLKIPSEQVMVLHVDLPGADWYGTAEHIAKIHSAHRVHTTVARWGDEKNKKIKTFDDYVLHRGKWPSVSQRWCTSDLKTAPAQQATLAELCRRSGLSTKRGCKFTPGKHQRLVVNCMGMRAEESTARRQRPDWQLNLKQAGGNRIWFDWLPIHSWSTDEVFTQIKACGQTPFWIYGQTEDDRKKLRSIGAVVREGPLAGKVVPMERMSCTFCIMASTNDLGVASLIAEAFAQEQGDRISRAERIADIEEAVGFKFKHGTRTFREILDDARKQVWSGTTLKRRQKSLAASRLLDERPGARLSVL